LKNHQCTNCPKTNWARTVTTLVPIWNNFIQKSHFGWWPSGHGFAVSPCGKKKHSLCSERAVCSVLRGKATNLKLWTADCWAQSCEAKDRMETLQRIFLVRSCISCPGRAPFALRHLSGSVQPLRATDNACAGQAWPLHCRPDALVGIRGGGSQKVRGWHLFQGLSFLLCATHAHTPTVGSVACLRRTVT